MFRLFGRSKSRLKKKGKDGPLMLAHRGARKEAPENTLSAFRKAMKMGFDGIEMDVVLTKDHVPVVFHGDDLAQTTNAKGMIFETLSKDLSKIDAGVLFGKKFEGEKIPTLSEALALLADSNMFINIEIKRQPKHLKGVEKIVAEMVYHYCLYDRVIISSFSPWILKRFSKIAPKIPTALLTGPNPFFFLKTLLSANMLNVSAINPVLRYTSETLVSFAHMQGWRVFVWTVNTKQEYQKAINLGVDGIITDEPDLLRM